LAKVTRLIPFEDLSLPGRYAERFGQDPDDVFWKNSFSTVINFAIESKEREEYNERFQYLWHETQKQ